MSIMSNPTTKLTASVAGGMSALGLQALTAPLFLVAMAQRPDASPRWVTGLYIALELGAMAAAAFVLWGMQTKHRAAHLAPMLLVAPFWAAIAVAGPFIYSGAGAVAFGIFSLSMGTATSLPFATRAGLALFERPAERPAAPTSPAAVGK
jgi:hypothetical protein